MTDSQIVNYCVKSKKRVAEYWRDWQRGRSARHRETHRVNGPQINQGYVYLGWIIVTKENISKDTFEKVGDWEP